MCQLLDKHGDASRLENCRGITLCSVLAKLFEMCLLDKFGKFLCSHDLQFGFKVGMGCSHAVYVVQQVINYFNKRGSTVYIAALDASKAFDRIDHKILVNKLLHRDVPLCFLKPLKIGILSCMLLCAGMIT